MKDAGLIIGIIAVMTICIFGIMAGSPKEKGVDVYWIDGCQECECSIICYGGSTTKLICKDSTGHMNQVEVLNHQVHPKK